MTMPIEFYKFWITDERTCKRRLTTYKLTKDEAAEHRKHRLENFLTFLGPGGFATPDDIEALESCHRGYLTTPDGWNDVSRDCATPEPPLTGEHQLRAFWRRWQELLAPNVTSLAEVRRASGL